MESTARNVEPFPAAIVIQERYADVAAEGLALFRAHGKEIGFDTLPRRWQPALNLYRDLEQAGQVVWLSVRDDSLELIGYALLLFGPSTLFSGAVAATVEWIYIRPEHREVALLRELWQEIDKAVKAQGAVSLNWSVWKRKGGKRPSQVTHWRFF
jgi:GNAT superfamily N-acetyltransferase